MGKSRRHSPFAGLTTAESEKKDKQHANRKTRRRFKVELEHCTDYDDLILDKSKRDYSNVYDFSKDGCVMLDDTMENYEKMMRK